jgi:CubicO group peptidase (beta-lactamase class C family)
MLDTSRQPPKDQGYDQMEYVTGELPGGNGYGPANQLVRLYRMLLNQGELDGVRLLSPETAELFTARHREGLYDRTFRATLDWGLGFIMNSRRHDETNGGPAPYGYGPHASDDTFGHGGNQCSTAFADPEHRLAAAVAFNGMPGEPKHQKRMRAVLAAIYESLGLMQ